MWVVEAGKESEDVSSVNFNICSTSIKMNPAVDQQNCSLSGMQRYDQQILWWCPHVVTLDNNLYC